MASQSELMRNPAPPAGSMLGIEAETFMNNKKFSPSAVTTLVSCVSGTVETAPPAAEVW